MKKFIPFLILGFVSSCTSSSNKSSDPIVKMDSTQYKVEAYMKGQTNNADLYKSMKTTNKALVTDTSKIKECFIAKYKKVEIDFNKPVSCRYSGARRHFDIV